MRARPYRRATFALTRAVRLDGLGADRRHWASSRRDRGWTARAAFRSMGNAVDYLRNMRHFGNGALVFGIFAGGCRAATSARLKNGTRRDAPDITRLEELRGKFDKPTFGTRPRARRHAGGDAGLARSGMTKLVDQPREPRSAGSARHRTGLRKSSWLHFATTPFAKPSLPQHTKAPVDQSQNS